MLDMIFAAALALGLPVQATDWRILGNNDAGTEFAVDRASVREMDGFRSARTRANYRASKQADDAVAERLYIEEFDCAGHRTRLRQVKTYSDAGALLKTFDYALDESEWQAARPETIADSKLGVVCA